MKKPDKYEDAKAKITEIFEKNKGRYSNPDLRQVKAPQEQEPGIDIGQLIEQLQKSPELANQLAALIAR